MNTIINEVEEIKKILNYDLITGEFTWAIKRKGCKKGNTAGALNKTIGYRYLCINYKKYLAHRVAWAYVHGEFPKNEIDHIDGNKQNNAISNLREATRVENTWNTKISKRNTSGFKNVSLHKKTGLWRATLNCKNANVINKYFKTKEDAVIFLQKEREKHHGNFSRSV